MKVNSRLIMLVILVLLVVLVVIEGLWMMKLDIEVKVLRRNQYVIFQLLRKMTKESPETETLIEAEAREISRG